MSFNTYIRNSKEWEDNNRKKFLEGLVKKTHFPRYRNKAMNMLESSGTWENSARALKEVIRISKSMSLCPSREEKSVPVKKRKKHQ
jgi:hypothetical protein